MDRLSKQSRDAKKSSKVEETKKCETSEQRAKRYSPFKPLVIGGLLATTGMIGAMRVDATMPSDYIQHSSNSLPERHAPSAKDMEQTKKLVKEIENPSTPFRFGPKDTQRGETSQSSMDKNKGKKQLSSKDIANLRSLMEKAKEDPETRQRVRKMLAERKLIVGNPFLCLDVSASDVTGSPIPSYVDTGLPGIIEQVTYSLDVRNACGQSVDNVVYDVVQTATCPGAVPPTTDKPYAYEADPFLVPAGQHSGMLGPKNTYSGCKIYENEIPVGMELPTVVKVKVQAIGEVPGEVPGTVTLVTSPEKIINVI